MNIRFQNLGKIKETQLELKPLTVIVGPNNSNKTYIAYSIYGLWQSMGQAASRSTRSKISSVKEEENAALSFSVDELRKEFHAEIQLAVKNFEFDLGNFCQDSSQVLFSKTHFDVEFSKTDFDVALGSLAGTTINFFGCEYTISVQQDRLYLTPIGNKQDELVVQFEAFRLVREISVLFRERIIFRPYLLPAERNAFVITYKVLAHRRLKLLLDAQRRLFSSRNEDRQTTERQLDLLRGGGGVRYPQPVEDFLDLLLQIENEDKPIRGMDDEESSTFDASPRPSVRRPAQAELRKIAGEIERSIQDGNKVSFRPTALGGQEIMVDVGGGLNIDLHNASSSIKQLAPLLLYLRYRAAANDLLIIDEPEMNLHPESQAKLLEVLAMLVNQGVSVLLTTHSPYLLAHLNNLVQPEDTTAAAKRRKAKSLYLGNAASLLNMEQISAYEMRDNELHSLKDPDYGIRYDTLSDVSVELQQKYFKIHE